MSISSHIANIVESAGKIAAVAIDAARDAGQYVVGIADQTVSAVVPPLAPLSNAVASGANLVSDVVANGAMELELAATSGLASVIAQFPF